MKPLRNVGYVYRGFVPIVSRFLIRSVELQCDLVRVMLSVSQQV